jgi:MFS family permease
VFLLFRPLPEVYFYEMNKKFRQLPIAGLIGAEFLSLLGNQVAAVTIPVLMWQQTHSIIVTSVALMGNAIPFMVAVFIAGLVINNFGARNISIMADLLSFAAALALPLVIISHPGYIAPWLMLALIYIGALFDPTGVAARHSLVGGLTRLAHKRQHKVNTIRGSLENAADFLGPAIGIGLISLININNTFFANAASFLLSAVIVATVVPKRSAPRQKINNNIRFAIAIIYRNQQLRTVAVTGIILGFVISAFLGLLLFVLAMQRFDSARLFGLSLSVFSISATISALLFSKFYKAYSPSFIYYGGMLLMGLGICICGVVTTQYAVLIAVALSGAGGAINPLEQTILQQQAPLDMLGQIFAILSAARFAAGSLGLLFAGLLLNFFTITALFSAAGAMLVITSIAGWRISPFQTVQATGA